MIPGISFAPKISLAEITTLLESLASSVNVSALLFAPNISCAASIIALYISTILTEVVGRSFVPKTNFNPFNPLTPISVNLFTKSGLLVAPNDVCTASSA